VATTAIRGLTNERGEFLITTVPVTDTGAPPPEAATVAHFAEGGGWTTQIVLVNPTDGTVTGTVQFISRTGQTLRTLPYTLAPRGFSRTANAVSGPDMQTGWVRISSPVSAFCIFEFRPNGVTVTQASVPAVAMGTAVRAYVETGAGLRTAIAIANPST